MIEAYDLRTLEQMAQFRTVSPVAGPGEVPQGFVRVYFKWRGLSADMPMRILVASIQRSIPGQNWINKITYGVLKISQVKLINSLSLSRTATQSLSHSL